MKCSHPPVPYASPTPKPSPTECLVVCKKNCLPPTGADVREGVSLAVVLICLGILVLITATHFLRRRHD